MKTFLIALAAAGLLALLAVLYVVGIYNGLVNSQQAVDAQWAQVQNVYQRRADLVPNLVNTVAGAAQFEKSTLTEITEARASVGKVTLDASKAPADAAQLAEFEKAQGRLSSALSRLLVVSERYPDLKATGNFSALQSQLEGSENRIAVERGRFNDAALAYNAAIKRVPAVFFAAVFGFKEKPYFAATPAAQTPPEVKFDFSKGAK
ncbi:MAG: LemA family protein [Opitutus sp.]|jgi:LemA protein|nr:LemA family protein [Opitutus sp.]MCS6246540.1 LemA family protein [Opitutus sp.]MCS6274909.1 LemA family protein [Opitutus sp.]MCS6278096.1 LemA family protein [Opitutus sp.]MCS6298796.1 LemA family protein [Opitutus sp.]